jgi:signal peptide peptidase SppA
VVNAAYAHVMARLVGVPLLAHPRKALIFYNALCGRFGTAPADLPSPEDPASAAVDGLVRKPEASRFVGEYPSSAGGRGVEPFRLERGVGIITITGSLVNRGAWVGSYSGQTSYEGIKFQLDRAGRDPRVKAVILDMESPGGEAVGAFEVAGAVRQLSAKKRTVAVVNGMAASAGYAIASGASKIVSTPTGVAGSIGVVLLHLDYSQQLAADGIKPTLIFAGDHKVDGNYLQPLPDSVQKELKDEVDRFYSLFLTTVAEGRGRRTPVSVAKETEGRTYIGQDAVDARLADDVGTFEEVLASLKTRAARSGSTASAASAKKEAKTMKDEDEVVLKADADRDREQAVARAKSDAKAEGLKEGREAAHTRLLSILSDEKVKGKEGYALKLAVKAPDMPAAEVVEMTAEAVAAAPAPAGPRSVGDRAADSTAEQVSGRQTPAEKGGQSSVSDIPSVRVEGSGWKTAVASVNARTAAADRRNPRRASR